MKLNKTLINNILQLCTVQLLNYIFPIIMTPYLLRIIGINGYGKVSVALAIVQFLLIISDYGFNFTATQKIAIKGKIENKLFSTIYLYKVILAVIILFLLIITLFFQGVNSVNVYLFVGGFFIFFVTQSFIPMWLFRGLNKMIYISILTFLSKAITIILLFIFIRQKNDFFLIGLVYGIPSLIVMVISVIIIKKRYKISWSYVSWRDLKKELYEGKDMFLSNIIGTLYTTLNPIILSIFSGTYATGVYSTCEKIIGAFNGISNAVSQAVYPIVCKVVTEKPYLKLDNKLKIPISFIYFGWWPLLILILAFLTMWKSKFILELIIGNTVTFEQIILLRIMVFIPFAVSLGHLFGIQTLLPMNNRRGVRVSIVRGAVTNIVLGISGAIYFGAIGMGIALLICEMVVAISMLRYLTSMLMNNKIIVRKGKVINE